MDKYMTQLAASLLFREIDHKGIQKLFDCLAVRKRKLKKDEFVFHVGDDVRSIYFLLSGRLHIIDEDFWGNRSIIETMTADTLFGEAYVLSHEKFHLVSVLTTEDSIILEMDPTKLLDTCPDGCDFHTTILRNIAQILSTKIVKLTCKVEHIVQRTTQSKLRSYFSACAIQARNNAFDIPYSRQQLADYLCVERSALSHELSKMRDAGVIRYHKNHFELLKDVYLD